MSSVPSRSPQVPGPTQRPSTNKVGKIESQGVEYVSEEDRTSTPLNLFWILIGGNLTFAVIVIGVLPVVAGLGWWATVSSLVVGSAIGGLFLAPMALLAPRTGTNNPVSSGAFFGVVGRIGGSAVGLLSALGFAALAIWTGGDALVAGAHKLIGTPMGNVPLAIGYGVIAVIVTIIAVLGHASLLATQKLMVPLIGLILLAGVFIFWPKFDSSLQGGSYLLGSFWPTWVMSMLAALTTVISYGPFIGDWARYISPRKHSNRSILVASASGAFLGLLVPMLFGAFTASTFQNANESYVAQLIAGSPLWFTIPIMIIGLVAGASQGTIDLYGCGLDTASIVPKLNRVQSTLVIAVIATILVYLGTFVWNALDSVSAFLTILGMVMTPWMLIIIVGHIRRKQYYDPDALQVFNRGERGGRYWFWNGVNVRAYTAWFAAVGLGLLFANTTLVVGPFAQAAGGVDLSFAVAGVVAVVVYIGLEFVYPEPAAVYGDGNRFGGLAGQADSQTRSPDSAGADHQDVEVAAGREVGDHQVQQRVGEPRVPQDHLEPRSRP